MKYTVKILLLVLIINSPFLINNCIAQTEKDWVRNGDDLIEQYRDYYGASIWYKKALDVDSTVLEIAFKYAEALRG